MGKIHIKTVIDVCKIRQENGFSCRDCIYAGAVCDEVKGRLQLAIPAENHIRKTKEIKRNGN